MGIFPTNSHLHFDTTYIHILHGCHLQDTPAHIWHGCLQDIPSVIITHWYDTVLKVSDTLYPFVLDIPMNADMVLGIFCQSRIVQNYVSRSRFVVSKDRL